jgi:hypothetical protein
MTKRIDAARAPQNKSPRTITRLALRGRNSTSQQQQSRPYSPLSGSTAAKWCSRRLIATLNAR